MGAYAIETYDKITENCVWIIIFASEFDPGTIKYIATYIPRSSEPLFETIVVPFHAMSLNYKLHYKHWSLICMCMLIHALILAKSFSKIGSCDPILLTWFNFNPSMDT